MHMSYKHTSARTRTRMRKHAHTHVRHGTDLQISHVKSNAAMSCCWNASFVVIEFTFLHAAQQNQSPCLYNRSVIMTDVL